MIRNIAAFVCMVALAACTTVQEPSKTGPLTFSQGKLDALVTALKTVCVDHMGDSLAMTQVVNDLGGYEPQREMVELDGKSVPVKHYRLDDEGEYLAAVSFYGDGGACGASYAAGTMPNELIYRDLGITLFDGSFKRTKAGYTDSPRLGVAHLKVNGRSEFEMIMFMTKAMYQAHQNATGAPQVSGIIQ
ncbi:hypothetical protein [Celeribacter sp.]|uniref:hypothetical protein n=1 Tax=Celeribacter sp. TaxID=1890673 RepID=UPI003A8D4BFE